MGWVANSFTHLRIYALTRQLKIKKGDKNPPFLFVISLADFYFSTENL
jgi:hypothetical protein